ncbi:MAG TPA: winged helix-turn-helix domain-containing protein [Terriglobales bacterium]|nr:winged helix-turn-helix domain-containing protein [Terriglobales bacterium]
MPLNGPSVRFAEFELDLKTAELRNNGQKTRLQDQPFQVLVTLLEHPGDVVTREDLRHRLWPTEIYVDYERSLNTAVKRLRQALRDEADTPRFIETLPRHGYRFIGELKEVASPVEKKTRLRTRWIVAAALALLLSALALLKGRDLWYRAFPPHIRSIAVLPLQNLSHDSQQDYFADGMTEALISELSRLEPLRVISMTSAMRLKDTKKTLPQIAKELDVDGIVEGSVLRDGDQVRIRTRLVQARIDRPIWTESYDRDMRDILTLQAEVAHDIAGQIQIKLSADQKARTAALPKVNPEAHEAYLQALYFTNRSNFQRGIAAYQVAIQKDPNFAPAYAGLAFSVTLNPTAASQPIDARAIARKALSLDESLAEAHCALATVYLVSDWNWDAAEKEYRRALQLDPSSAINRSQYAYFLAARGHLDEGLAEMRQALRLDPLSLLININYGRMLYFNRRYDDAIAQFTQMMTLDTGYHPAYLHRGFVYLKLRRFDEAFADIRRSWVLSGNTLGVQAIDDNYPKKGPSETLKAIARMLESTNTFGSARKASIAMEYAQAGEIDKAFEFLESAARDHARNVLFLKVDPTLDNLRSDPRFADMLRRIGLPD